jgi:predicted nucleic acid-binding Zn ribbon protein
MTNKKCEHCGKTLYDVHGLTKYCDECRRAVHNIRRDGHLMEIHTHCETCGKVIEDNQYNRKYCSDTCRRAPDIIRRRGYGFIPLNNYFYGSEGHHINHDFVIYIPEELHRSVWHRQTTWQGMDEINKLAFKYLHDRKNYNRDGLIEYIIYLLNE